jgi:hypothetical protein
LFGVSPADPLTYVIFVVVLTLVAVAACWGPARRAARETEREDDLDSVPRCSRLDAVETARADGPRHCGQFAAIGTPPSRRSTRQEEQPASFR